LRLIHEVSMYIVHILKQNKVPKFKETVYINLKYRPSDPISSSAVKSIFNCRRWDVFSIETSTYICL